MPDHTPHRPPPVRDLLNLNAKIAVVTGASGGIGSAIARRLAEAGAAVVVHYHHGAERAAHVVDAIRAAGGNAVALQADLRTEVGCHDLLQQTNTQLGRPDILVNNAGIQPVSALAELAETELKDVMTANINAPILLTRCFAALQRASTANNSPTHQANPHLSITHIASIEGLQPALGHSHYASSKAALLMFTRAATLELGPLGIRINAVSPGLIAREGLIQDWPQGVARYQAAAPLGDIGRNTDIADAVLYLSSAAARWVSGSHLVVDGGVSCAQTW